jgi:four helix bundle protein
MRMEGLDERVKAFALRVIRLFTALPKSAEAQVLGKQALRSGTSVAANFREASRARSDADFMAKLGIVEQELSETMLWFELLIIVKAELLSPLHAEAEELLKIMVTAIPNTKLKG